MAKAYLVAGLGFGDEGKGSITDYLCRQHDVNLVIRYNGGAQAGHNVVLPDGRHHCFSQFSSGTFVPDVETFLSRHMIVNPIYMYSEANHLQSLDVNAVWKRVIVEKLALVTNPFQVAANRLRELYRGGDRHGSCGMGVGETVQDSLNYSDALRAGDLDDPELTKRKLKWSQERKLTELQELRRRDLSPKTALQADLEWAILQNPYYAQDWANGFYRDWSRKVRSVDHTWLSKRIGSGGTFVFEGAQGVLLDENYGFHPHTTWSTTTFKNAHDLLEGIPGVEKIRVGVIRTHMTRHGAGPFPTYDPEMTLSGEHNTYGDWQQNFKVGPLDTMLTNYALKILGGVDLLALTHMNRQEKTVKVCRKYLTESAEDTAMIYECPDVGSLLSPSRDSTLAWQEKLGGAVSRAKPEYTQIPVEKLGSILADTNGHVLYSYGPTYEDKCYAPRNI